MKKYILYCLTLVLGVGMVGCENYSKYGIDERPITKIDTNMFGIWKALEDSNRYDYFIVQSADDLFKEYGQWVAKNATTQPTTAKDFVKRYKETKEARDYKYYITRMDNDGLNRHYEKFGAFPSKVGRATFLNIPYFNFDKLAEGGEDEEGYMFVRILDVKHNNYLMTVAVVSDKSLKYLPSSAAVRKHISKNLNNPLFYSDTLHLIRVSNYHESVKDSRNIANHREPPVE